MNLREMATRIMNNKGTLPLIFEACAYSMLSTKLLNISQKWPERIIQAEQDRNLKSLKSNYAALAILKCKEVLLLYKTNKFHFAVRLFSCRSQRTSKCGKNISNPFA